MQKDEKLVGIRFYADPGYVNMGNSLFKITKTNSQNGHTKIQRGSVLKIGDELIIGNINCKVEFIKVRDDTCTVQTDAGSFMLYRSGIEDDMIVFDPVYKGDVQWLNWIAIVVSVLSAITSNWDLITNIFK